MFHAKIKMLKFTANVAILKILHLGLKTPSLGIFGLEFENAIVIFQISALEFIFLQILVQIIKLLNLGPKISGLILHIALGYS